MKKLGIIGGTSWNSTALYYDHINREIARRLGGLSSARLAIESIDLAPYAALQNSGDLDEAERIIVNAGSCLKASGAEAILIASNTSNRFAKAVESATGLPLLGIAHPTIARLNADGRRRVALLGRVGADQREAGLATKVIGVERRERSGPAPAVGGGGHVLGVIGRSWFET